MEWMKGVTDERSWMSLGLRCQGPPAAQVKSQRPITLLPGKAKNADKT